MWLPCDCIQVWELVGGTCTQVLQGHTGGVTGATLCGVRLVSSSIDKSIIVWDMESGLPAKRLLGHTASVNCVASIRDDRVVSGGDDYLLVVRSSSSARHTRPCDRTVPDSGVPRIAVMRPHRCGMWRRALALPS